MLLLRAGGRSKRMSKEGLISEILQVKELHVGPCSGKRMPSISKWAQSPFCYRLTECPWLSNLHPKHPPPLYGKVDLTTFSGQPVTLMESRLPRALRMTGPQWTDQLSYFRRVCVCVMVHEFHLSLGIWSQCWGEEFGYLYVASCVSGMVSGILHR